jgi:hypothetical protein
VTRLGFSLGITLEGFIPCSLEFGVAGDDVSRDLVFRNCGVPNMSAYVIDRETPVRIDLEDSPDQVLDIWGYNFGLSC